MLVAACYGVLQLALLASATRSVRVTTLLLSVPVGLYACGALAVVLQMLHTRATAAITGEPLNDVVRSASYTIDPFIEEIVKVLPLVLIALYRRVRNQWGLTDYLLLGAGTGAGFGLVEALLRFGHEAGRAGGNPFEGWTLILGLNQVYIPGPFQILTTWLPAPSIADSLLSGGGPTLNLHLAYSALAGFGIGVLLRGKGWLRLLGLIPIAYASIDHAAFNYALVGDESGLVWTLVGAPVAALRNLLWLLPVVLLAVAFFFDRRDIRAGKASEPGVLLAAERNGRPSLEALGRYATLGMPWTALIAMRFALLRRSMMFARACGAGDAAAPLRDLVQTVREQIDLTSDVRAWRGIWPRIVGQVRAALRAQQVLRRHWMVLLALALVILPLVYFVLGGFPLTGSLQRTFATSLPFSLVTVLAIAGMVLVGWRLWQTWRALPAVARHGYIDAAARLQLQALVGVGALAVGLFTIQLALRDPGPYTRLVSNVHILEALARGINLSALLLAMLALLLLMFPPLALAGGGMLAAQFSLQAMGAAVALGLLGMILQMAGQGIGYDSTIDPTGPTEPAHPGDLANPNIPRPPKVPNIPEPPPGGFPKPPPTPASPPSIPPPP